MRDDASAPVWGIGILLVVINEWPWHHAMPSFKLYPVFVKRFLWSTTFHWSITDWRIRLFDGALRRWCSTRSIFLPLFPRMITVRVSVSIQHSSHLPRNWQVGTEKISFVSSPWSTWIDDFPGCSSTSLWRIWAKFFMTCSPLHRKKLSWFKWLTGDPTKTFGASSSLFLPHVSLYTSRLICRITLTVSGWEGHRKPT